MGRHNSEYTLFFKENLHSESGQEVHGNYVNGFSEKIIVWPKWAILSPKLMCLHNPIISNNISPILQNVRSQEVHEINLNGFLKKVWFGPMGHFRPKNDM